MLCPASSPVHNILEEPGCWAVCAGLLGRVEESVGADLLERTNLQSIVSTYLLILKPILICRDHQVK